MSIMAHCNASNTSDIDPWSYFYMVQNDSERYDAWLCQVEQFENNLTNITQFPQVRQGDLVEEILTWLKMIYTPLAIGFGVLGNSLTCLILLRSRLRSLSSSHYLAATVLVNTLYLVSLFIQWLTYFGYDMYNRPGWCQFVKFLNSSCTFLSVWYMTAFCVDRYICICWPTEAPKMCTRMRARVVIICLLCMGIVVHMNISLTVGIRFVNGHPRCVLLKQFHQDMRVLEIVDLITNLGLPYTIVLVLTLLVMANTWKVQRHRVLSDDPAQIRSVTIIFLVLCLACHLPNELFRVVLTTRSLLDTNYPKTVAMLFTRHIVQHLFHTSLACHFIVFVLCYPMFAQTCKTPFLWVREKMLMTFRKAPNGDINLRNVRFHAVQEEKNNVAHV